MCGIAGILCLDPQRQPARDALEAMTRCLRHRGPDDEGLLIKAPVGLGHRRLSIIDVAGGHQPLSNEDGSVSIVYNGEIYNFAELRRELEKAGHRFATHSDTETIIHAYEQYGTDCLQRFNGMFAFALWDARQRRLFCARDRMGQKPFYYTITNGQFLFASEMKAFYCHPDFKPRISPTALSAYLAFEYVPAPMTILEGVAKLQPGHWFSLELDHTPLQTQDVVQRSYWDIHFAPRERSDEELSRELLEHLQRAVERRLISEVPLGVFLSGGIDSSAIVAMMARLRESKDIKTFTISFDEPSFDESAYARRVAEYFGADHYVQPLRASAIPETLPDVASILDEPFADPSIMPTFLLSKFTREHVTVALGGDGGDELFAGYDPFAAHAAGRLAACLPRPIRAASMAAAGWLPTSHSNISLDFKVKRFLRGVDFPAPQRHWAWLGSFTPAMQRQILSPELLKQVDVEKAYAVADQYWQNCAGADDLNRTIYQYCKLYLQDDIHVKVDRASMAHGLEARAPMMDHEFVEWAATVPSNQKLHGSMRKYILKKALRGVIPDDIIARRKKGFGMPIGQWFRGPLKQHLQEKLSLESLSRTGFFRTEKVQSLVDAHLANRRDNRKELWTLLMFMEWFERYGG